MVAPRLTVELVPSTCWGSSLKGQLSAKQWDWLRRRVYRDADYHCEICGQRPDGPVHCHEVWSYDDALGVQKLEQLKCVCPPCHDATHPGFADAQGRGQEALERLADVNGWPLEAAQAHQEACFEQWARRSERDWTCDLSLLREYGIPVPRLLDDRGHQRRVIG